MRTSITQKTGRIGVDVRQIRKLQGSNAAPLRQQTSHLIRRALYRTLSTDLADDDGERLTDI